MYSRTSSWRARARRLAAHCTLFLSLCAVALACDAAPPSQARLHPTSRDASATPKPKKSQSPAKHTTPSAASSALEPVGEVEKAQIRPMPDGVVDGDTIKAVGFPNSLRLLNIDTEEVFKDRDKEAMAAQNWQAYLARESKGKSPQTFATPMGEAARDFARDFFRGVEDIWLEYQSATYTREFFDRHLVTVWVKKDDKWLNYNLEAVRAGMSPYYTKYGYSPRLHDAFLAAEQDAQKHKRGIWAPGAKAYPDYPARRKWWDERADQIQQFRQTVQARPDVIDLASDTAFSQLRDLLGKRVIVFGSATSFAKTSDPQRIRLAYRYRRDLPVVAFKPLDMRKEGIDPKKEHFIYAEGVVELFRGDPQIRYDEKSWLRAGSDPPK